MARHLTLFWLASVFLCMPARRSPCEEPPGPGDASAPTGPVEAEPADAGDDEGPEPGEVVVTATRTPVRPEDAPAVVNLITREDIERLPARNLADVVKDQVGVRVDQPRGQAVITALMITMRGLRSTERTLLLVDGQPWNSSMTDFFYFTHIPVEAAERVEIVRGPFSSLYGSNAMAGVIQVFTRDGSAGNDCSANSSWGNFGRWEKSFSVGQEGGPGSAFVSYSDYDSDNYYLNDERDDVLDLENRVHEHRRLHLHSKVAGGRDFDMSFSAGAFNSKSGDGIGDNLGIVTEMDVDRDYINATGTWRVPDKAEVFFGLDYLFEDHTMEGETLTNIIPPPPFPVFDYDHSLNITGYSRRRLSVGANVDLGPGNKLTLGGECRWIHGEKRTIDAVTGALLPVVTRPGEALDSRERDFSIYVQDTLSLAAGRVDVAAGLRYDDFDAVGGETSPKVALVFHYADNGRVKASAGRAFRSPSIVNRETPAFTMAPYLTFISNPDLEPETIDSYEISLENEFLDGRIRTRVTPFCSRSDDFITYVIYPDPLGLPPALVMQAQNFQKVRIEGIETEITFSPVESLRLFGNYQYAETRDEEAGDILDNHPRNIASFGAVLHREFLEGQTAVSMGIVGRYEDERHFTSFTTGLPGRIGGYTVYDAKVSCSFLGGKVAVSADLFNLFDKDYFGTNDGDILPERNWTVGLQLKSEF